MRLKQKLKLIFLEIYLKIWLFKNRVRVKKIISEEELNLARNFAWRIYALEKKYIDSNFFPKKMFIDEFDKYSIYFGAFHNREIIGIVRLVLNSKLGFPIEKVYRLNPLQIDKKKIAEISRLIVIDNNLKKNVLTLALCEQCVKESLLRGITHWYAFLPPKLKNYFEKKYGVSFIEIKYFPPTNKEQSYRKPYRFYFSKFDPKPYLISLEKTLENFRI